jgi:hypothetical protein
MLAKSLVRASGVAKERSMRALILIPFCFMAACYSYYPLSTATPEPGGEVSVTLTDGGAQALERDLGFDVFLLHARYLSSGESGLVVSVTAVETKGGDLRRWAGETVTVPLADIASVDLRRLAKGRTILLASAGAVGVVVSTLAFSLSGGGTPQGVAGRPPAH